VLSVLPELNIRAQAHKTAFPCCLYGYEIRSLTLSEEHTFQLFEYTISENTSGPQKDEILLM
jgi:hypothetical protein